MQLLLCPNHPPAPGLVYPYVCRGTLALREELAAGGGRPHTRGGDHQYCQPLTKQPEVGRGAVNKRFALHTLLRRGREEPESLLHALVHGLIRRSAVTTRRKKLRETSRGHFPKYFRGKAVHMFWRRGCFLSWEMRFDARVFLKSVMKISLGSGHA